MTRRILYVSAFLPSENARHAGGRVAHENLARLREQGHEIDVVVCTTENEDPAPALTGASVIRQTTGQFARYVLRHATSLGPRTVLVAAQMHGRLNGSAEDRLVELLRRHRHAETFADFTQSVLLLQRALARAGHTARVTACLHDVLLQRSMRRTGWWHSLTTGAMAREEQVLLDHVDSVLTLSGKDRDLVAGLYGHACVQVKPFRAPEWCARVQRSPQQTIPGRLLFFANFAREENDSAARWFIDHALDEIARSVPEVELVLAGSGSDDLAARIGHPRVSGTGFRDDPSDVFSRCACAIAPLSAGAGVKFKVLEALACGVPVVGTPVACEGIDPQAGLTCVPRDRFVATLAALMQKAHHAAA